MKQSIWKFALPIIDGREPITLTVPAGTRFISGGSQNGNIIIWGLCPQHDLRENREIIIFGTGWDISKEYADRLTFIATCQAPNNLVWHVFEVSAF